MVSGWPRGEGRGGEGQAVWVDSNLHLSSRPLSWSKNDYPIRDHCTGCIRLLWPTWRRRWWCLPLYKQRSLYYFPARHYQKSIERVGKSNPQLKLCVILAIGEPMGSCNLNVHMTSRARNSLILRLMQSSRSLCKQWEDKQGVYGLRFAFGGCRHA